MGRWTIGGVLGMIALIAVSLAAIREASLVWAAVVSYCVGASFILVATFAVLRRVRRTIWLGFSALGGGFFLLTVPFGSTIGPIPGIGPFIDAVSSRLDPPPPPIHDLWLPPERWMKLPLEERKARTIVLTQDSEKDRIYTRALVSRREASRSIFHSLLSLLIGIMGGMLAWLATCSGHRTVPPGARISSIKYESRGRS
jgi:hypothetical protein